MFLVGGMVGALGFQYVGFCLWLPLALLLDRGVFATRCGPMQNHWLPTLRNGPSFLTTTKPNRDQPPCKPNLAPEYPAPPTARRPKPSCANACTAAFAPPPAPPTKLLGDELDGPRGRIYLIKQVLEGSQPTRATQMHLDRCLTCRNCETTCPSGVQYGHLVDIGRKVVDEKVQRPWASACSAGR